MELGERRDTTGASSGYLGGLAEQARWISIRERVAAGVDTVEIVEDHPHLLANFASVDKNFRLYQRAIRRPKPTCEDFIPNPWSELMPLVKAKKRHYWIFSACPNVGKTTEFLEPLSEKFRCSWYSKSETFQAVHIDTQFVLIDEYSEAHLKVTQLNEMCDGNYQYPVKGGYPVQVKAVLLICGNKNPKELYPKAHMFLEARFNVLEITADRLAIN
jgi:hypothetical protein